MMMLDMLKFAIEELKQRPLDTLCLDRLKEDHLCSRSKGHPGHHMVWGATQGNGKIRHYTILWTEEDS